ncbi:MAG: hypothetical protein FJ106_15755 [Deltaproteobacteria bacterium]|nr:hypothetical protein [Deltaproteobacteria bacterium]
MIIGDFHVQHILKAYSQQLSVRSRISKDRVNKQDGQKDEVTLSKESKKMLVVDKIAKELIAQLTNGSRRNETSQAILNRLSQEYGRPLDVASDGGQGIAFKVLGETDGGVKEYLAPAENNQLEKRLYEMTKSFVNEQLI